MINPNFNCKQFIIITLIVSIWVNLSEVFRYFVLVMPRMKEYFPNNTGIAEMDIYIFSIWGLWDTLLTALLVFIFWIYAQCFGNTNKSILVSGTLVWLSVFVIFWVATANMGLSSWSILLITLPLSLFEMIIGAWLSSKLYSTHRWST